MSPVTEPVATRRALLAGGLTTGVAGILASGATPLLHVPAAAASVRPRGLHLTYGADPRHRMALSWATPASVRRPVLELGTDRSYGLTVAADSRSSKDVDTIYHHVDLRRLDPDTTYHYRVRHRGATAATGSFTTAPDTPRPFRFVTFGDMGVNASAAAHVALIRRQRPDLAFVVGDLCYADASGGTGVGGPDTQDFATWDRWLDQIQPSARAVPWMTTVGNHEMEAGNGELGYAGYLDRFLLPDNGAEGAPVTYSFVHGNVGFVALDGNDASYEIDRNRGYLGSQQDAWLARRLAALRARDDIDFVVVGFHHCAYCTNLVHGSDGGMRDRWEPLFDRFGVDLVVNGHNHCYERTHPVRAGVPVMEAPTGAVVDSRRGTTYLTAGGAGQTPYPVGGLPASYVTVEGGVRVPEAALWSATASAEHSIAFVDVTPRDRRGVARMRIVARRPDGSVLDRVTLERRG